MGIMRALFRLVEDACEKYLLGDLPLVDGRKLRQLRIPKILLFRVPQGSLGNMQDL